MMGNVKLGIIGLGRLGRKHAENIHYLTHDYDCARWFVNSDAKSVYGNIWERRVSPNRHNPV